MIAESKVAVTPLNGKNYSTWKVQCMMALLKEGLWNIVSGEEAAPEDVTTNAYAKFKGRSERALANIVLTVDLTLLYLLGKLDDLVTVWKKLSEQFQKKTWENKLALRHRLYSLQLKDSDCL